MKRLLTIFAVLAAVSFSASAQNVFTLVYATSDDGFVNVRETPSTKARVVEKVYEFSHGVGNAMVLGYSGNWTKVSCNGKVGYAYSKYLEEQTWYSASDSKRIVATTNSRIYGEDYSGEMGKPVAYVVKPGTIIASQYEEDGQYYVLTSAHDNLYVRKQDVKVVSGGNANSISVGTKLKDVCNVPGVEWYVFGEAGGNYMGAYLAFKYNGRTYYTNAFYSWARGEEWLDNITKTGAQRLSKDCSLGLKKVAAYTPACFTYDAVVVADKPWNE